MLIAVALSLATGTLVGVSISQRPAPGARHEEGQPQPNQSEPAQSETNPAPLGTERRPLVVREMRSGDQAAEDQQDRKDQQANRRYSLWLSIITTAVIGFQVWLLLTQNDIIKGQTAIMERQAKHMEDGLRETQASNTAAATSADAMGRIAAAMELQGISLLESLSIQREMAGTNTAAYITHNRAFLHLTQFAIEWGKPHPKIFVVLKNTGRLTAIVRGWAADAVLSNLPDIRNEANLVHYGNSGPVAPDASVTLEAHIPLDWKHDDWRDLLQGKKTLSIWGVLNYETGFPDVAGETGFGFEYVCTAPHSSYGERFAATDAPGYNYSR